MAKTKTRPRCRATQLAAFEIAAHARVFGMQTPPHHTACEVLIENVRAALREFDAKMEARAAKREARRANG